MKQNSAIAVLGTFDSKGEEHRFLKEAIEKRGLKALTINVGTKEPSSFPADIDLYEELIKGKTNNNIDRDKAIQEVLTKAKDLLSELYYAGKVNGVISAGGGTGTHLATGIMRVLPMGVPKVMISTVASRDMSDVVGTKDITMIHSVIDLLGVNSISGGVLDRAAGAVCGMVQGNWRPDKNKRRIALTMFGFITEAAENIKDYLEEMGYEVIAFHANGTGGMAMEELAAEGLFDGILDLATHELADELKGGYCRGIGPGRLAPGPGKNFPRLVVPGGLDCAVLEFTRDNIPAQYEGRKIFFYDFRSAIRLNSDETRFLATQLSQKLNNSPERVKVIIPMRGWSEADRVGGPLFDPNMRDVFIDKLMKDLSPSIPVEHVDVHINDHDFARQAAKTMDEMLKG